MSLPYINVIIYRNDIITVPQRYLYRNDVNAEPYLYRNDVITLRYQRYTYIATIS